MNLRNNIMANQGGIPRIESQGVVVNGTTNVQFRFNPQPFFSANSRFAGGMFVKLEAVPTGTTDTLPVVFVMNGKEVPLSILGGTAATVADLPGAGIYWVFFDAVAGMLQALNL